MKKSLLLMVLLACLLSMLLVPTAICDEKENERIQAMAGELIGVGMVTNISYLNTISDAYSNKSMSREAVARALNSISIFNSTIKKHLHNIPTKNMSVEDKKVIINASQISLTLENALALFAEIIEGDKTKWKEFNKDREKIRELMHLLAE